MSLSMSINSLQLQTVNRKCKNLYHIQKEYMHYTNLVCARLDYDFMDLICNTSEMEPCVKIETIIM